MRFAAIILSALIFVSCAVRVEYGGADDVAVGGTLDVNTATADEFERLPGVGRGLAERIVEFRRNNGPFRRREHLLLVPGIGEARYRAAFPSAAR